jgi:hypothetical protein
MPVEAAALVGVIVVAVVVGAWALVLAGFVVVRSWRRAGNVLRTAEVHMRHLDRKYGGCTCDDRGADADCPLHGRDA